MYPPDLATATAPACSMFCGKAIRPLGFSYRGDFIGERASSEVGPAPGWAAPPVVSLAPGFPLSHLRSS
jgi:hypothetical protein